MAGTGHSFVPLCATRGTTLLLSRLEGLESIDAERRQATVLAGGKLYQVTRQLSEAGLAMSNLPDIDRQALAGALSTATHGTGRELGSLSTQMVGAEHSRKPSRSRPPLPKRESGLRPSGTSPHGFSSRQRKTMRLSPGGRFPSTPRPTDRAPPGIEVVRTRLPLLAGNVKNPRDPPGPAP